MDKLIEILEEVNATIDYKKEDKLIDDGLLDSLSILYLVTELENEYEIDISPVDLIPENFNSAEKMYQMINQLQGK